MVNWLVGTTDRFKAAVSENGVTNQISRLGQLRRRPRVRPRRRSWATRFRPEGVDKLWRQSPLRNVASVQTPLLMLQAEADLRCPAARQRAVLHRAPPPRTDGRVRPLPRGVPRLRLGRPTRPPDRPDDADARLVRPLPALTGRSACRSAGGPILGIAAAGHDGHHRSMTFPPRRPRHPRAALTAVGARPPPARTEHGAGRRRFPRGFEGYHTYAEVGARSAGRRGRPSGHRPALQHRQELPGPRAVGDEDLRQRRHGRVRARGPVRRRPPRRRAHGRRDDAQDHALARRRLRHRPADHEHRRHAARSGSSSTSTRTAPSTTSRTASSTTGARTASRRPERPPSAPTSTATTATAGAAAAGRARTRAAITYRGPMAFSAPETRAVRDFLASRVVDGRQQIRTHITFHEAGRLVMWPYGYTYTNVPADMTKPDHDALVHIGRSMAATQRLPAAAGERPVHHLGHDARLRLWRLPDLLVHVRDVERRLPRRLRASPARPAATRTPSCTSPSGPGARSASSGTTMTDARCGAFDDDFEAARGWVGRTRTAPTRRRPVAFARGQPRIDLVERGQAAGHRAIGLAGVRDRRPCGHVGERQRPRRTHVAPLADDRACRSTTGQRLFFRYVFAHGANSSSADKLVASIEDAGGTRTPVVTVTGSATDVDGAWQPVYATLDAWAGQTIRIHFEAVDGATQQPGRSRDRRRPGHARVVGRGRRLLRVRDWQGDRRQSARPSEMTSDGGRTPAAGRIRSSSSSPPAAPTSHTSNGSQ